jgi:hypothetical protein
VTALERNVRPSSAAGEAPVPPPAEHAETATTAMNRASGDKVFTAAGTNAGPVRFHAPTA